MRGVKAKALRRIARSFCDSADIAMIGRPFRVNPVFAKDKNGDLILQDGKPITLIPEHTRSTMFWPRNTYRRVLRVLKTGRAAAPWTDRR